MAVNRGTNGHAASRRSVPDRTSGGTRHRPNSICRDAHACHAKDIRPARHEVFHSESADYQQKVVRSDRASMAVKVRLFPSLRPTNARRMTAPKKAVLD